ncbi:MAG: type II secretion system protein [Vampirovibrionia bacterium]
MSIVPCFKNNNKGVTLIELAVVIILLGILAFAATPRLTSIFEDADAQVLRTIAAETEIAIAEGVNRGKTYNELITDGSGYLDNILGFIEDGHGGTVNTDYASTATFTASINKNGVERSADYIINTKGKVLIVDATGFNHYFVYSGDLVNKVPGYSSSSAIASAADTTADSSSSSSSTQPDTSSSTDNTATNNTSSSSGNGNGNGYGGTNGNGSANAYGSSNSSDASASNNTSTPTDSSNTSSSTQPTNSSTDSSTSNTSAATDTATRGNYGNDKAVGNAVNSNGKSNTKSNSGNAYGRYKTSSSSSGNLGSLVSAIAQFFF